MKKQQTQNPLPRSANGNANPFGLLAFLHWNHAWNNWHFSNGLLERAVRQIKELGIAFVRVDILWADIYKDGRGFDFSRYDAIISELEKAGLHVLALLQYNKIRENEKGEVWNHPPDSFEEFANYVRATVSHYKGWIRHWEVWNEPNHPFFWVDEPDQLKRYAQLLKLSRDAAKSADPNCTILNGGLTEPIVKDVRHFYEQGGKNLMDILSIHTFLDPSDANYEKRFDGIITGVLDVMDQYGDSQKPIWITEMGAPGLPAQQELKAWFAGPGLTESQQADWVETQYNLIQKYPRIGRVFWAFYRDTQDHFKDATDYLGLVRFDLTPKPSFERMKKLIESHGKKTLNPAGSRARNNNH